MYHRSHAWCHDVTKRVFRWHKRRPFPIPLCCRNVTTDTRRFCSINYQLIMEIMNTNEPKSIFKIILKVLFTKFRQFNWSHLHQANHQIPIGSNSGNNTQLSIESEPNENNLMQTIIFLTVSWSNEYEMKVYYTYQNLSYILCACNGTKFMENILFTQQSLRKIQFHQHTYAVDDTNIVQSYHFDQVEWRFAKKNFVFYFKLSTDAILIMVTECFPFW